MDLVYFESTDWNQEKLFVCIQSLYFLESEAHIDSIQLAVLEPTHQVLRDGGAQRPDADHSRVS